MSVPDSQLEPLDEIECPVADCEGGKRWVIDGDESETEPCEHLCHMTEGERRELHYAEKE